MVQNAHTACASRGPTCVSETRDAQVSQGKWKKVKRVLSPGLKSAAGSDLIMGDHQTPRNQWDLPQHLSPLFMGAQLQESPPQPRSLPPQSQALSMHNFRAPSQTPMPSIERGLTASPALEGPRQSAPPPPSETPAPAKKSRPKKNKKDQGDTSVKWSPRMCHELLTVLREAVTSGKVGESNGYKAEVWNEVLSKVLKVYNSTAVLTVEKCQSKYYSFQNIWKAWKAHLGETEGPSGWGSREEDGLPTTDPTIMDRYFKAHPERARFRDEYPPYYEILQAIFEGRLATGSYAGGASESDDDLDEENALEDEREPLPRMRGHKRAASRPTPSKEPGETGGESKKASNRNNIREILDRMDKRAEKGDMVIQSLASDVRKLAAGHAMAVIKAVKAIREEEDMSDTERKIIIQALSKNPTQAEVFLGLEKEDRALFIEVLTEDNGNGSG